MYPPSSPYSNPRLLPRTQAPISSPTSSYREVLAGSQGLRPVATLAASVSVPVTRQARVISGGIQQAAQGQAVPLGGSVQIGVQQAGQGQSVSLVGGYASPVAQASPATRATQAPLSSNQGSNRQTAVAFVKATDSVEYTAGQLPAFDVNKSTEDNYRIPHFTGRYAHLRPLLDYTWHVMYHPARIDVQDDLIDKFSPQAGKDKDPLLPWVVFTAGAMGAGKGYVREWMTKNGHWPLERFVIVDPDAVRESLPEWSSYVAKDSTAAGNMTQKEAGCIAELIGFKALHDRRNVVFDGSLRDVKWYKSYFHRLRQQFPGIRIMILHIMADRETVLKRAEDRGKETGRVVPLEMLNKSMDDVPKSVSVLSELADFTCRIMNLPDKEPFVVHEPDAPSPPQDIPMSWDLFSQLWSDPDLDGDGVLDKHKVHAAICMGILTQQVLDSVDFDKNGGISKDEILEAQEIAQRHLPLEWFSAAELASQIRDGKITSLSCVNFFAERIERLDVHFNLVIVRFFEEARERAREADAAAANGEFWGPLHGVPMTLKESFCIEGKPTTLGEQTLKDYRPKKNAVVVNKLLGAGAIIIGKTNFPRGLLDIQSFNDMYGTSNNPWNVEYSPGGSSGGSAGAVAAGFTPIEMGSDIGGSIRGPAHCCGIVAHKPTLGVIDSTGCIGPFTSYYMSPSNLYVVGPMARCCSDLELVLDILAGPSEYLEVAWSLQLPPPPFNDVSQLRVAVCWGTRFGPYSAVVPDVAKSIQEAGEALAKAGASVNFDVFPDESWGVDRQEYGESWGKLFLAEGAGWGATITHGDYLRNESIRWKFKEIWAEFFKSYDVLLCPVATTTAIKHDHSFPQDSRVIADTQQLYPSWSVWNYTIIYAKLPVTVVPVGKSSNGLPIGVQVVGGAFQDRTTIRVGAILEKVHRGFEAPNLDASKL